MNTLKSAYGQFALILLINTVLFILLAYFLPIHFEENDDIVMSQIASGAYSGTPDAHLVFINYLYGQILVFLYSATSSIEWYTVLFAFFHIISTSVIIYSLLKSDKSWIFKAIFIFLFYVIEFKIALFLQFTTTAAVTTFAGILLLFKRNKLAEIFGLLFIVFGFLIRYESAGLILLLGVPIFLNQLKDRRKLILLSVCVIALGACKYIDSKIYDSDPEWRAYGEYNPLRRKTHDNPNDLKIADKFPVAGVSLNDYKLLLHFFIDEQVLNSESLKEIGALLDDVSLLDRVKNIYPSLGKYKIFLFLITLLFVCCVAFSTSNKQRVLNLLYYLFFIALLSGISMGDTLKYRVFVLALFPLFFYLFVYIQEKNKILRYLSLLIIIYFGGLFLSRNSNIQEERRKQQLFYSDQLSLIKQHNSHNTIIPFAGNLDVEYLNPFAVGRSLNNMIGSGWLANIPFNKGRFDSFKSLCDNDLLLFISVQDAHYFVPAIQQSLKDNYNYTTEIAVVDGNEHYLLIAFIKQ